MQMTWDLKYIIHMTLANQPIKEKHCILFKKHGFSIPLFGPQTAPGKAAIYWELGKMFKNMWRR